MADDRKPNDYRLKEELEKYEEMLMKEALSDFERFKAERTQGKNNNDSV